MTQQALAVTEPTLADTMQIGELLAASGFFQDSRGAAQAVVKVLAGREMGFGPIASMTGIYVINGRVTVSANLMAAAVKRSGRYDYRVLEMTAQRCVIEFRQRVGDRWEAIGNSEFTAEDAKRAGTKNMDKFAKNMLFARAMSNGARWFCPDIFGGPVYTPDELGASVDGETGEVIEVAVTRPAPAAPVVTVEYTPEPGEEVWADWRNPSDAMAWAMAQGKFNHQRHAENAYSKVKAECAPKTARDMWRCWWKYVTEHEPVKAAGAGLVVEDAADDDGWADIDAHGHEQPQFN